jgi:hypothetical protein
VNGDGVVAKINVSIKQRESSEHIRALNGASMRATWTRVRRVKHVWGGMEAEAEMGRKVQKVWTALWGDSTYIRL